MAKIHPAFVEYQRKRFMRPDAKCWIQPRTVPVYVPINGRLRGAAACKAAVSSNDAKHSEAFRLDRAVGTRRSLIEQLVVSLRLKLIALQIKELRRKAYNPLQPRDQLGKWTDVNGQAVRLASNEKPKLGRGALIALLAQTAKKAIDAFRSDNILYDLFGDKDGTVGWTSKDGTDIFGSNSELPTYTTEDDRAAKAMRKTLIEKYPDLLKGDAIGQKPNDALFHAETTVLLRAAKEYGGSLANQKFDVFVDRPMCPSCDKILPLVGMELGNPTVTFIGPKGTTKTMHNGTWNR